MSHGQDPAAPLEGERWSVEVILDDLQATAGFAEDLASLLNPGVLLVLTGGLGAGKTTFTQALGGALGVSGMVSSPTFILSRIHRAQGDGPDLVHVDAYRTDPDGLESLDLSSTLADSVTVVEWGRGMVEAALVGVEGSWLDLELIRGEGTESSPRAGGQQTEIVTDFSETEADVLGSRRRAVLRGYGPDWARPPQLGRTTMEG
ncbi:MULTISPECIES: tRNA (adenosine(37)-N6)-threonylcarbamoyltransferase complex ATPase subunit type 1 TsaE [unclassified Nesterenkonia]|uniref:tRNA (adenosine(37)-N6)-threonylcarbamoyltransferase complex ATPase subunit type 1 TsaE n=1 Tax=unclassified Nesterenkonia TaxID=2629769 RepID=UPI001F4C6E76|nr:MULTISPECIES: tRNA (adenosine(37)-N6)-threonylcarbamoyltransferase complex ATPase subunit type 1 TsaE [unclassified Nesterenkonia]MCH8560497.1 tRNA (adenosine(37)-N6)-threonylcarbamoyltransferase complex ATPase subunit type 1 TsaE [Nesterenkonia sp. DZ6]MCH8570605.1 tRNA (adenosine(37)-N6)-threonylcarbamoyltransferase complex ATPase subunit type 1 TsaE [Nesterenkonia sp. AY15]